MKKINVTSKLMSLILFFGMLSGFAQTIDVKGVVTDNSGEPLPGAEIVVVGTNHGVVSDFDGNYVIKAENGQKLRASYVGMKSKTVVVSGDKIDFVLQKDALGLDEVVVTAQSGIVTKRQLGSVIHSVKMGDIEKRNVTNISEALQGALPGAQIMRNSGSVAPSISIRLRGPSTVLGSSEPLIMIDGVIINNDTRAALGSGGSSDPLSDIDMNDIDHIEIIKGPAASAMYGSMASNGIIQIFTRRGKTGEPSITVSSNINVNQIRKYKPYNKALFKWDGVNKVPVEERYDYQGYLFRKAMGTYSGVGITGGTDWTSYSVGGSWLKNEGILRNSNYDRKNLNLNIQQKLSEWLKLNVGVIYSNNLTKEIPYAKGFDGPLSALLFVNNDQNPYNPDGSYANMGGRNPYEKTDVLDATLKNNRVISNFSIHATPVKRLKIDYDFGYDFTNSKSKYKIPYGTNFKHNGLLKYGNNNYATFTSHIHANYNYNLTSFIKASTGLGYQYLYNKKNIENQTKSELSIFPNIEGMDGANNISSVSSLYEYAIWGTWFQQHFTIYDKFHLTVGGRWDQASTFGDDVQSFYPKVSGSIVLSDFDFWNKSIGKFINSFKLRGAWGEAGNMSALTDPSKINVRLGTTYYSNSYLGQTIYLPNLQDGNLKIKPEVTNELEYGFDAAFLDNRIGVEFTIYHQKVDDMLLNTVIAPSTGLKTRVQNVGILYNDGIELTVKGSPVKQKNFSWESAVNFSKNKNRVEGIDGGYMNAGSSWALTSIAANGYPLGVFYGPFYATDANGNWVLDANGNPQAARGVQIDKDGDGFAESYEQHFDSFGQPDGDGLKKIIGDPNPDFIVSFNNTFTYKNLSLNILLEAVQGYDVIDWDKRIAYKYGGYEFTQMELENNHHGWYSSRYGIFESFIEDGSFVKLRNVSLSYNWRKPVRGIKALQFTLSGSNLISWDRYWGYDPEVNSWGKSNGVRSQDFANIPIPKVYAFGVKFKF